MEKIGSGRSRVNESIGFIEIIIPSRKNYFVIGFFCFWLCGWLVGELSALAAGTGIIAGGEPAGGFIFIWLAFWTIGGLFALATVIWMIAGKEILTFEQNKLTINRKGWIFNRPKIYHLQEIKCFSVNSQYDSGGWLGYSRRNYLLNRDGALQFDYGMKTIKMAEGIDPAEARHLLLMLKNKGFLKEENTNISFNNNSHWG
jgi:hypothetical protein